MPNPEPVSRWPGRVRWTVASCLAVILLSGCAIDSLTARSHAADDLEFLDRAMSSGPAAREAMWRETSAGRGQEAQLRVALMQSVPNHSGSDPAAAQRNLRSLLAQNPPQDIAALARVRLDELRSSSQCVGETQELRHRLAQVVNIERDLDNRGR